MIWYPVDSAPKKEIVLIARLSGYVTTEWEYMTAIYNPDYRGWTDISNDRLTDSGNDPLWWSPLPEPPEYLRSPK